MITKIIQELSNTHTLRLRLMTQMETFCEVIKDTSFTTITPLMALSISNECNVINAGTDVRFNSVDNNHVTFKVVNTRSIISVPIELLTDYIQVPNNNRINEVCKELITYSN